MSRIRPYRPTDRAALYEICVKTADAGADATGVLSDDSLWGEPCSRCPTPSVIPISRGWVESDDERTIGYIVATDDTDAFYTWFREEWWPTLEGRHPRPVEVATREDRMIDYGYSRAAGIEPNVGDHPAHLHIDLLPETQGQGLGRQLIETLFAELTRRGGARAAPGDRPEQCRCRRLLRAARDDAPAGGAGWSDLRRALRRR